MTVKKPEKKEEPKKVILGDDPTEEVVFKLEGERLEAVQTKMDAMEEFTGIKVIKAIAMTRGAYNTLRGWTVPEDENPDDLGYLTVEPGESNTDAYIGHVAWSPLELFASVYIPTGHADAYIAPPNLTGKDMNFGDALLAMEMGKGITRPGYGPKYFVLVENTRTHKYPHFVQRDKNVQFQVVWTPTSVDHLSKDWTVLD